MTQFGQHLFRLGSLARDITVKQLFALDPEVVTIDNTGLEIA